MMYCAECGEIMTHREIGGWNACCNRIGYWYGKPPLASDLWAGIPLSYMGYWFYPTAKWPKHKTPTFPNITAPSGP